MDFLALFIALCVLAAFVVGARYVISSMSRSCPKWNAASCRRAILHGNSHEFFSQIELFSEKIAKNIRELNLSDTRAALQEILKLPECFVKAVPQTSEVAELSLFDRVNYPTAFLLHRLEWLFQIALHNHVEPIAEEILSTYAKMCVSFTSFHPALAQLPLVFIERAIDTAHGLNADEVASRGTTALSEIVKNFIQLSKEKNESLKEPIIKALQHLHRSLKSAYMRNKGMNVALLMQPFAEIASFIVDGEYKAFLDRDEIFEEIKRYLRELNALDVVIQREQPEAASQTDESRSAQS